MRDEARDIERAYGTADARAFVRDAINNLADPRRIEWSWAPPEIRAPSGPGQRHGGLPRRWLRRWLRDLGA